MNTPYVIAEAGTNHNGCLDDAIKLVELAVRLKAESVKFQIINPAGLYVPMLLVNNEFVPSDVYERRRKYVLPYGDYEKLKAICDRSNIDFSASIFDDEGLDFLVSLKPRYIKIASCDLNNHKLIRSAARKGIKIVLSTGMSTLSEIRASVDVLCSSGHRDFVLMHCISIYPASLEEMNLGFLRTLSAEFACPVGLSDHTRSSVASCVSIALGASVLEKHLTYDRNAEGFDHANALNEDEFAGYLADVRATTLALKGGDRRISDKERDVSKRARRSVYAARDLSPGECLRETDILIVRPEASLPADAADSIINKRLRRPLRQFEPLSWADLE